MSPLAKRSFEGRRIVWAAMAQNRNAGLGCRKMVCLRSGNRKTESACHPKQAIACFLPLTQAEIEIAYVSIGGMERLGVNATVTAI